MKKTIIFAVALAFATFANAAEIVLKPQGWKEGDSKKLTEELIRSHTDSTTGSTPRVVSTKKTPNKISVQSADSDKYIISIMTLDTGYTKSDSNSIFGAELAKKVRTTPLKFSLSKDGELGHSVNYEEFEALFADSQHPFYKTFIIMTLTMAGQNLIAFGVNLVCHSYTPPCLLFSPYYNIYYCV